MKPMVQPNRSTKSYLRGVPSLASTKLPFHLHLVTSLFLYLCCLSQVHSLHTNPKIYDALDSSYYCFRRLNQTHQIGCASKAGGNYGIAKIIRPNNESEDLDFLSSKGPDPPYVAIVDPSQFSNITLLQFLKNIAPTRVSGLLVLDTGRPSELSSDRSCPNEFSSLYLNDTNYGHCRTHQWNKPTANHVEGMMFMDLPFPVFLLRNKTQIDTLKEKMKQKPLDSWPKLAVEMLSPMHAAKDSVTCMRRSSMSSRFNIYPDVLCDPLGGFNIFHHSLNFSSIKSIKPNSVVMLAARQDSFSMFEALAPGADSAFTSVVAILAVAEMLYQEPKLRQDIEAVSDKSLLLALFDGEAFDYIGSSDVAYRMHKNTFPSADPFRVDPTEYPTFDLKYLSHFIELNQLAQYNNSESEKYQLFLHKNLKAKPKLADLIKYIEDEAKIDKVNLIVTDIADNNPLPPSSAQSFLKMRNDDEFSVLVAANHEKEYTNKFYNSFYEDGSDFSKDLVQRLTDVATLFGRVAYKLITGNSMEPTFSANNETVKDLLTCFLKNSNCNLFQQAQDPDTTPISNKTREPFSTYVSVYGVPNALREYTRRLMFRFTGETVKSVNSSSECKKLAKDNQAKQFFYIWQYGKSMKGECIRSSAYMTNTASPAFNQETAEVDTTNLENYAFWTESKWQESSLRMFVVPSGTQKWVTAIVGVIVLALSFAVVIFLDRHAVMFFGDHSRPKANGANGTHRNHNSDWSSRTTNENLPDDEPNVSQG